MACPTMTQNDRTRLTIATRRRGRSFSPQVSGEELHLEDGGDDGLSEPSVQVAIEVHDARALNTEGCVGRYVRVGVQGECLAAIVGKTTATTGGEQILNVALRMRLLEAEPRPQAAHESPIWRELERPADLGARLGRVAVGNAAGQRIGLRAVGIARRGRHLAWRPRERGIEWIGAHA